MICRCLSFLLNDIMIFFLVTMMIVQNSPNIVLEHVHVEKQDRLKFIPIDAVFPLKCELFFIAMQAFILYIDIEFFRKQKVKLIKQLA